MNLQAWCRSQLRWLDADRRVHDLTLYDDCKSTLVELKRRATEAGLPDVIKACRGRTPDHLREALATCLGAIQPLTLTPPQAAEKLGVKPATVLAMIRAGKLKAINTGQKKRPRYKIAIADLDEINQKAPPVAKLAKQHFKTPRY